MSALSSFCHYTEEEKKAIPTMSIKPPKAIIASAIRKIIAMAAAVTMAVALCPPGSPCREGGNA